MSHTHESESFEALEGRCACGEIRYRVTRPPLFVHGCHCTWCQRETGSAFAVNALVEAGEVILLEGTPETVHTPSASGRGQDITRCPICRVAVWSNYSRAGRIHFIRVGTLDEPHRTPPDIHIYTSTKQSWVVLPPDVPAVPEFYAWEEYWPADSLARRSAAIADLERSG